MIIVDSCMIVDGLPDGSEKPGEAFVLKHYAGLVADSRN